MAMIFKKDGGFQVALLEVLTLSRGGSEFDPQCCHNRLLLEVQDLCTL